MDTKHNATANQLRSYIERIERLEEDKANILADIREVFQEAKGNGFDPKIMRQVLKIRKMDHNDRQEQEELLEVYLQALGMAGGADAPQELEAVRSTARN